MDLFTKKDLTKEEYLLVHVLAILGMRKVGGEKLQKIMLSEENK